MIARAARGQLGVLAWLLVAGASVSMAGSASARSRSQLSSPVKVVRAYLGALAAHDASGVCETFSLELKRFLPSSSSLQPGEPLLAHPLNAGDIVPALDGLTLPPPARDRGARRCVAL